MMSEIEEENSQATDCEAMLVELRARRALIAKRLEEERRQVVQAEAMLEEAKLRRHNLGDQTYEHENGPVENTTIPEQAIPGVTPACGSKDARVAAALKAGEYARSLQDCGGPPDEVCKLLRRSYLDLWELLEPNHTDTLSAANNLAVCLEVMGESAEALILYRQALAGRRKMLGEHHPFTLDSGYNLAAFLVKIDEVDEAELLFREVLEGCLFTFGWNHHGTLDCAWQLQDLLMIRGEYDEARQLCEYVMQGRASTLGEDHRDTLRARAVWAQILDSMGLEEAVHAQHEAASLHERHLGISDPATLEVMSSLARCLAHRGESDESLRVLSSAFEACKNEMGEDAEVTLGYTEDLAMLLDSFGQLGEASSLFSATFTLRRRTLGDAHKDTLRAAHNYAVFLERAGRREEAEQHFLIALHGRRTALGWHHEATLETLDAVADLRVNSGEGEEAEFLPSQTLRTLEAQCGPHDTRTIECAEKLANLTQVPISGGDQAWGLVPRPSEECFSVGSCTPRAADLEDEIAAWDSAVEATNCYDGNGNRSLWDSKTPAGSGDSLPADSDHLGPWSNLTGPERDSVDLQALTSGDLRACSWSPRRHSLWNGVMETSQEPPQVALEFVSSAGHAHGIQRSTSV